MAKRNFFIPETVGIGADIPIGETTKKEFTLSTEFLQATSTKVLNKFGFRNTFDITFFDDLPVGISALGLPIMDNLTVPPGAYALINAGGLTETIFYEGIQIDTVVMEASQQKNIVKTQVAGRDGTVKEYISSDDTTISITGAIINSLADAYPRRQVIALTRILQVPQQIRVISKFINDILGFEHITILSWNFPQTPGLRNTQAFTIEAVNDISPEADETTGDQIRNI